MATMSARLCGSCARAAADREITIATHRLPVLGDMGGELCASRYTTIVKPGGHTGGDPVVAGPHRAIRHRHARRAVLEAFRVRDVRAREGDDSPLAQRTHLAGIDDAVGIGIAPDGQALELAAGQPAVAVVVERAHGR